MRGRTRGGSKASAGIDFSVTGTEYIRGEVGSVIEVTSPGNNTLFLGGATRMGPSALRIEGMTVKVTGGSSGDTFKVFSGCSNLTDCTVILEGTFGGYATSNHASAFYNCFGISKSVINVQNANMSAQLVGYCSNLSDVVINYISNNGTITGNNRGFYQCKNVSNCVTNWLSTFTGTVTGDNHAFYECFTVNGCSVYSDVCNQNMFGFSLCEIISGCNVLIDASGPSVLGLYGFNGCKPVAACRATITRSSGYTSLVVGFSGCVYLSACWSYITALGTGVASYYHGYENCDYISDSIAYVYSGYATNIRAFYNCENLTSCAGTVAGGCFSANPNVGFSGCVGVVNCRGQGGNGGAGAGYGFQGCQQCQHNSPGTSASQTSTYTTSYADTSTNATAYTAAGGYNRVT